MSADPDRLYQLLPAVVRASDIAEGYPLRDLLRVIGEQVDLAEEEIRRLYDNLFIETCEQWAIPYIGELVGYRNLPVPRGSGRDCGDENRTRFLVPRRAVADTIRLRRRKGTLGVIDDIALAVSGWPSEATDAFSAPHPQVTVTSWRLPSWPLTRVRAKNPGRDTDRFTLSVLGNDCQLYESTMRPDPVDPPTAPRSSGVPQPIMRPAQQATDAERMIPDHLYGEGKSLCLYENDIPIPASRIRLCDLGKWKVSAVQDGESPIVALDPELGRVMFPSSSLTRELTASYCYGFATDLGGGEYPRTVQGPSLSDSLFRPGHLLDRGVAIRYALKSALEKDTLHDAEKDDTLPVIRNLLQALGNQVVSTLPEDESVLDSHLCSLLNGILQAAHLAEGLQDDDAIWDAMPDNEAIRLQTSQPTGLRLVRLNRLMLEGTFPDTVARSWQKMVVHEPKERRRQTDVISTAIETMQPEANSPVHSPVHMVVELADSGLYPDSIEVRVPANRTFELRAAEGCRPHIMLQDRHGTNDNLLISCESGSRVVLDGLLISGNIVQIVGNPAEVLIRHCTFVPGWDLDEHCTPTSGDEPSLILGDEALPGSGSTGDCPPLWRGTRCVRIERSIIGSIIVDQRDLTAEPVQLRICASIVDATDANLDAIASSRGGPSHAVLDITGSTIIGLTKVRAFDVGENTIFWGAVDSARQQVGCLRYSSIKEINRTPPRYACHIGDLSPEKVFMDQSLRYGQPNYCRLKADCSEAIRTGADDGSEMGTYHHLYLAQRVKNLELAIADYLPLGWTHEMTFGS